MEQSPPELFVIENHDQLYHIWSERDVRDLHVCHIDFHCDLRGLLIDRAKQLAYKIPDIRRGVDIGNFLSHAILEGRVEAIHWIHSTPGGRGCDVNTVKYTEDLTSLPYNLAIRLNSLPPMPLEYAVNPMASWPGPVAGDFLDIDWDVFAEREIELAELDARVEEFFDKQLNVPVSGIAVCYSPGYSHETRPQFERFVNRLQGLYHATRIDVPDAVGSAIRPFYRRIIPPALYRPLQSLYFKLNLWLKRRGIY